MSPLHTLISISLRGITLCAHDDEHPHRATWHHSARRDLIHQYLCTPISALAGITLRAFKRMMMSSRIGPLGSVLEPHVAPNLTIPIFWAEESGEATADMAQRFKSSLYRCAEPVLSLLLLLAWERLSLMMWCCQQRRQSCVC
jgi:hypothetical protein